MSNTPVAVNHATADIAIFLMIGALRHAYIPINAIRAGESFSTIPLTAKSKPVYLTWDSRNVAG